MSKKSDLCFVLIVDTSFYQHYVPFFLHFCLNAYPDAFVLVYVRGKISKAVTGLIRQLGVPNKFRFIQNYKSNYPSTSHTTKLLRWTIDDEKIRSFRYAYIGDIDILIVLEDLPLLDQHLRHARFLRLPYSNVVRAYYKKKINRMSGLHFIKVDPYMKKMRLVMPKFDKVIRENRFRQYKTNEMVLYLMLKEAIGLPKQLVCNSKKSILYPGTTKRFDYESNDPDKVYFRPHHGIHIRLFETISKRNIIDSQTYHRYFVRLREMWSDKLDRALERSHPRVRLSIKNLLEIAL